MSPITGTRVFLDPDRERDRWLAWRRDGIGASDVAAIVGMGRFASPMSLYLDKTGELIGDSNEESEAMRWGRLLEPAIAEEFTERQGLYVAGGQSCWQHSDLWRRCTLDGLVYERSGGEDDDPLGGLEIKVTSIGDDWSEGVPDHYEVQGHWQMHVVGLERVWFAALIGARRLRIFEIERDETAIRLLVEMAGEFWNRVRDRRPPPVDAHRATTAALRDAWAGVVDNDTEVPLDELAATLDALRLARAQADLDHQTVTRLENEIKATLGDAGVGTIAGQIVCTWRAARAFDETRFRADRPDLWDKCHRFDPALVKDHDPKLYGRYLTPGDGSRRFLLKDAKETTP